ncbi:MAG: hypothetical protein ACD_63C00261G0005 [uncultured bacterium]|nr:MAG: hypothetical protein ACD_63C00261G0005 [uncultured bacterium]HBD05425.1 EF-P lysine aminoacylase GenX [Candidatus Uhrbacteria bacterium]
MNDIEKLQENIENRNKLNSTVREFFAHRGFLEVETPILVRSPGMEPNLSVFEAGDGGLRTSPEYQLKKLLGLGMKKIFEIARVFRSGEPIGGLHNPEFTMIEWYGQGASMEDGMKQTEELVDYCAKAFSYNGKIDLSLPWPRISLRDLFLEHVGIDLAEASSELYRQACEKHGIGVSADDSESDLFFRLHLSLIEPKLPKDRAYFIYDYPKSEAALSRLTPDGKFARRFEACLGEIELCNAFEELTDKEEQRARFETEAKERERMGKHVFPIDEELLNLLVSISNPTFGNALGLDRLLMALTGASSIDDVLAFPASRFFK